MEFLLSEIEKGFESEMFCFFIAFAMFGLIFFFANLLVKFVSSFDNSIDKTISSRTEPICNGYIYGGSR